jgi:hypothetical protein
VGEKSIKYQARNVSVMLYLILSVETSSLDRGTDSRTPSKRTTRGLTIIKKVEYEVSSRGSSNDSRNASPENREEFKKSIIE